MSLRIVQDKNKESTGGGNFGGGLAVMIFSALVFLCLIGGETLFGGFGRFLQVFFEGVFGVTSYAVSAAGVLFGYFSMTGRRLSVPVKRIRSAAWLFFALVMILHLATTVQLMGEGVTYGDYLTACYDISAGSVTGGGILGGVIVFLVARLIGVAAAYVIFSLIALLALIALTDFKIASLFRRRVKTLKEDVRAKPVKGAPLKTARDGGDNFYYVRTAKERAERTERERAPERVLLADERDERGEREERGAEEKPAFPPANIFYNKARQEEEKDERRDNAKSILFSKPYINQLFPDASAPKSGEPPLFGARGGRDYGVRDNKRASSSEDSYLSAYEKTVKTPLYPKFTAAPSPRTFTDERERATTRRPPIVVHGQTTETETVYPKYSLAPQIVLNEEPVTEEKSARAPRRTKSEKDKDIERFFFNRRPADDDLPPIINGEEFAKKLFEQDVKEKTARAAHKETPSLKTVEKIQPPEGASVPFAVFKNETPPPAVAPFIPPASIISPSVISSAHSVNSAPAAPFSASAPAAPFSLRIPDDDAEDGEDEELDLDDAVTAEILEVKTAEPAPKPMPEAQAALPLRPISILRPIIDTPAVKRPEQIGFQIDGRGVKRVGARSRYKEPPVELLNNVEPDASIFDKNEDYEKNARILEETLSEFNISAKVEHIVCGPTVTRYELEMAPGIPVKKVISRADDLSMRLAAKNGVRIEAPIPGKNLFGIEVPNLKTATVSLRSIVESVEFGLGKNLSFALGQDIGGANIVVDLADMPHLLIAGSTNTGKSVCLNSLIVSLLFKYSPDELRFILVDPKQVEFSIYNEMPHMMVPEVVTMPDKAIQAFNWLIQEMERRYKLFKDNNAQNITAYNQSIEGTEYEKLPRIVLAVDELADLMAFNKSEIEQRILRLAQKARAAGIHLVLATQRPSVDVLTGTIKANLPCRIALRVISVNDSKTILDQGGPEKLIGKGDMLLKTGNMSEPLRLQGAFVSMKEVKAVVDYIKENNESYFDKSVEEKILKSGEDGEESDGDGEDGEDSLFVRAAKHVIEMRQASICMLQRQFKLGYARAGRVIDDLEKRGVVSGFDGSKSRQVLISMEDFYQRFLGLKWQ